MHTRVTRYVSLLFLVSAAAAQSLLVLSLHFDEAAGLSGIHASNAVVAVLGN